MLILKGLCGGLFNFSLFAVPLLVPAALIRGGNWLWPRGLAFLSMYGALLSASVVLLALKAPASLEARLRPPLSAKQPVADRIVSALLFSWFFAWVAFIPVDVFAAKLLPKPPWSLSLAGVGLFLTGYSLMIAAIYQNSFAAPIVEDQTDRGQVVVDTGLYAWVRHPLYLGLLFLLPGIALWLGSYAALLGTPVFLGLVVARISVEEQALQNTLPGYSDYMQRVRYRLVPAVW